MNGRIPCSVPILTLNVRPHLERLLPVLKMACEDVYIVDGNSTDGTVEYAQSQGIRVERQFDHSVPSTRITDFTEARIRSWSTARTPWIFLVDADEIPTPELLERIRQIIQKGDIAQAHRFRRLIQLPDGRIVKHAFSYPEETMVRLFHRDAGITLVPERKVHERFQTPKEVQVLCQPEAFIHTWPDLGTFRTKLTQYGEMEYAETTQSATHLLRWVVWYNLRAIMGQCARAIKSYAMGTLRGGVVLPWSYTWPLIVYRMKAMRQGLKRHYS